MENRRHENAPLSAPNSVGNVWTKQVCPAYKPRANTPDGLKQCWYCKFANLHLDKPRALDVGVCYWPKRILVQFLDITLKKGANEPLLETPESLEIVQPFSFSGKTDVKVWRYHGTAAQALTKLEAKPGAPFTDGTFFADSKNGLIYVYASKFSTYAVSYQEVTSSSGGGSTSYSVTVNSSESGTVDRNVTVSATFAKQSGNRFLDVADHAYYHDAVLWAVENGVTSGTSATTFSPNMTCTRAQTVTFLWRAMGSPEPTTSNFPFTDVAADAYYYKAVLWAVEKGITAGTSATAFSPNATVTRGQTVTFLWRTSGTPTVTVANPFGDVTGNAYYANPVLWAVSKGITSGTSVSTFSPADGCTRAQIVTFLYRYLSR